METAQIEPVTQEKPADPTVAKSPLEAFLEGLTSENTARTYGYWLPILFKLMKITDNQLVNQLNQKIIDEKTVWRLAKTISEEKMKESGRRLALNALRSFMRFHDFEPPASKITFKRHATETEEGEEEAYLTKNQVDLIIQHAEPPYNLIFQLMYDNFWGAKEFLRFNNELNWEKIKTWIKKPDKEYYRINKKGRKGINKPFHSLISLELLRRIIKETKVPITTEHGTALGMENYRNSRIYLSAAFQRAKKAAKITDLETHGHVSLHELRDTARTQAQTAHVEPNVAEFMMGHSIDPNGYNKCWSSDEWVWTELKKMRSPGE
jgi:hypothetical protein